MGFIIEEHEEVIIKCITSLLSRSQDKVDLQKDEFDLRKGLIYDEMNTIHEKVNLYSVKPTVPLRVSNFFKFVIRRRGDNFIES